jgi:hypothetical protein
MIGFQNVILYFYLLYSFIVLTGEKGWATLSKNTALGSFRKIGKNMQRGREIEIGKY